MPAGEGGGAGAVAARGHVNGRGPAEGWEG